MRTIDEKDRQILDLLQEDAKRDIAEIARKVKLKESTVYERIRSLVKDNIILNYTIEISPSINTGFMLIILASGLMHADLLRDKKEVVEMYSTIGEFDWFIKVKAVTKEALQSWLAEFRKVQQPSKVSTLLVVQ